MAPHCAGEHLHRQGHDIFGIQHGRGNRWRGSVRRKVQQTLGHQLFHCKGLLFVSDLPWIAVCISSRTRCKESAISCLICCSCNVIKSDAVAVLACCQVMRLLLRRRISRASKLHLRWRLNALRYHDKCSSVLCVSQRECVGRVLCDKGSKCAGVEQCHV